MLHNKARVLTDCRWLAGVGNEWMVVDCSVCEKNVSDDCREFVTAAADEKQNEMLLIYLIFSLSLSWRQLL